jgi:hypothetical protein
VPNVPNGAFHFLCRISWRERKQQRQPWNRPGKNGQANGSSNLFCYTEANYCSTLMFLLLLMPTQAPLLHPPSSYLEDSIPNALPVRLRFICLYSTCLGLRVDGGKRGRIFGFLPAFLRNCCLWSCTGWYTAWPQPHSFERYFSHLISIVMSFHHDDHQVLVHA